MPKILTTNNLFLLTIFCMPLYLVRISILGLPTNVFELLAMLAIIVWTVEEKNLYSKKLKEIPVLLLISILLILSGILLSILFNDAYRAGFGILKSWFFLPLIFSYALYAKTESKEFIEKMFLTIFLSSAFVGFSAIIYKLLGVLTYDGRLSAFYLSPNHLAMYLTPGIFFGAYFLIKKFSKDFFLYSTLLLFLIIPLFFTYSYGAWLAVFISLFVTTLVLLPKKKLILIGLFIAVILMFVLSQAGTQKFSDLANFSERSSLASRTMIWKSAFLMIEQNPILGIGPGNFQAKYLENQKYFPPYLEWAVPEPHNIFLAFWTQTGLLGIAGFLLLLFFIFRSLFIIIKNKKDAFLAAPLLGFFICTVLHGLIDTPYWKNDLSFLFWICVLLTLSLHTSRD